MTRNDALIARGISQDEVTRLESIRDNSDDQTERLAAEACLTHEREKLKNLDDWLGSNP